MDGVPAAVVARHQGDATRERGEVDAAVEDGVEQGLVGPPDGGDHGHRVPLVVGQVGQHLLGQETVDVVAGSERPQLGQRRPPAKVVHLVEGYLAQAGEQLELVVGERQLGLVDAR
jgi:hypothetical protein